MTPDQLYTTGRDVVMLVIGVLVFYWGRDRQQTLEAVKAQFKLQDQKTDAQHEVSLARIEALEHRMEQASEQTSKWSGRTQDIIGRLDRLPEDLRAKFMPLEVAHALIDESRRDRAALWIAIKEGGRYSDRQTVRDSS